MAVDGHFPLGQGELHDLDHVKDVCEGAYIEVLPRKVVEEHCKTSRENIMFTMPRGIALCYSFYDKIDQCKIASR